MQAYYERRATEFDDWYLGIGLTRQLPGEVGGFTPEELAGELRGAETLFAGHWFVAVRS